MFLEPNAHYFRETVVISKPSGAAPIKGNVVLMKKPKLVTLKSWWVLWYFCFLVLKTPTCCYTSELSHFWMAYCQDKTYWWLSWIGTTRTFEAVILPLHIWNQRQELDCDRVHMSSFIFCYSDNIVSVHQLSPVDYVRSPAFSLHIRLWRSIDGYIPHCPAEFHSRDTSCCRDGQDNCNGCLCYNMLYMLHSSAFQNPSAEKYIYTCTNINTAYLHKVMVPIQLG